MTGSRALRLLLLFALVLPATLAAMIPLGLGGEAVPPDLVFALVLAWSLRAPEPVPVWALVVLGLFADLMLARPPGLGALGLMLAAEAMRALRPRLQGAPFPLEWLAATILFALVLGLMQAGLRLAIATTPLPVDLLRYLVATAIAYPVAAATAALVLGRARRAEGRA
jgi:rod shape-determining protein MreD